jgi:hypothetical protein
MGVLQRFGIEFCCWAAGGAVVSGISADDGETKIALKLGI